MAQTPLLILLASDMNRQLWPLHDVAALRFGAEPLLVNQTQRFQGMGFEQVVLVVNPRYQSETNTLAEQLSGLQMRVVMQPEPKGVADALLQAGLAVGGDLSRPVYITRVHDIVDDVLHQAMLNAHFADKTIGLLACSEADTPGTAMYAQLGEAGRVMAVSERAAQGTFPSVLAHVHPDLARLLNTLRKEYEQGSEQAYTRTLDTLVKGGAYRAVAARGIFGALDYPWQVLDVMNHYLTRIQGQIVAGSAFVSDRASIIGDVFIGAGARIFPGATISGPAYIGASTFIANNALVRNCMILNNCEIGFNCEVARSYIADNCSLHAATVLDSVFAQGVNFSAGCATANLRMDRSVVRSMIDGEERDTGRRKLGGIVGRDAFISVNCSIMPGVKVGARTQIGPGVALLHDVPDDSRAFVKQEMNIVERRGK
ncbi:MAG: hypothetical protein HXY40_16215 [Chloroflexi bacterium]|nr:hypothetical protein [Chloroflexota bacterium]